jgi:hypothetical protein
MLEEGDGEQKAFDMLQAIPPEGRPNRFAGWSYMIRRSASTQLMSRVALALEREQNDQIEQIEQALIGEFCVLLCKLFSLILKIRWLQASGRREDYVRTS